MGWLVSSVLWLLTCMMSLFEQILCESVPDSVDAVVSLVQKAASQCADKREWSRRVVAGVVWSAARGAVDLSGLERGFCEVNKASSEVWHAVVVESVTLLWHLHGACSDPGASKEALGSSIRRLVQGIPSDLVAVALPDACIGTSRLVPSLLPAVRRAGTGRFYKQSKYNLLAEASEGFAKSVLEVVAETPASPALAVEHLRAYVGRFRVDANRLLDLTLCGLERGVSELALAGLRRSVKQAAGVPPLLARKRLLSLRQALPFARLAELSSTYNRLFDTFSEASLPHLWGFHIAAADQPREEQEAGADASSLLPTPASEGMSGGGTSFASSITTALLLCQGRLSVADVLAHVQAGAGGAAVQEALSEACASYSVLSLGGSSVGAGVKDLQTTAQAPPGLGSAGYILGSTPISVSGVWSGSPGASASHLHDGAGLVPAAQHARCLRCPEAALAALTCKDGLVGIVRGLVVLSTSAAARCLEQGGSLASGKVGSLAAADWNSVSGAASVHCTAWHLAMELLAVHGEGGGTHPGICPPLATCLIDLALLLLPAGAEASIALLQRVAPVVACLGLGLSQSRELFKRLCACCAALAQSGSPPSSSESRVDAASPRGVVLSWMQYVIVPALAACGADRSASSAVWSCLGALPWHLRYAVYAHMLRDVYGGAPAVVPVHLCGDATHLCAPPARLGVGMDLFGKLMGLRADTETKQALKRVAEDTIRRAGQQFGKVAPCNGLVLFQTLLTSLQQYANLIDLVTSQGMWSMSPMSLDQAVYSLTALAASQRAALQEDGLTPQPWLSAVSAFCCTFVRRFPSAPIQGLMFQLQRRLLCGDLHPVWPLKALVEGGVGVTHVADIADSAVQGLAGPSLLKQVTAMVRSEDLPKAQGVAHFVKVLLRNQQAGKAPPLSVLLLALAQLRGQVLYGESSASLPLKIMGARYDAVHSLLLQLLEVVQGGELTAPQLAEALPSVADLFTSFSLPTATAWALVRPLIRAVTYPGGCAVLRGGEQVKVAAWEESGGAESPPDHVEGEDAGSGVAASEGQPAAATQASDPSGDAAPTEQVDSSKALNVGVVASPLHALRSTGMRKGVEVLLQVAPAQVLRTKDGASISTPSSGSVWDSLSSSLYSAFWSHDAPDIFFPQGAYSASIAALKSSSAAAQRALDSHTATPAERKAAAAQAAEAQANLAELEKSMSSHRAHTEAVLAALEVLAPTFVPRSTRVEVWYHFSHMCTVPRALLSPQDALFAARFILLLHELDVPNLSSIKLFTQTLACCVSTLPACTEVEAVNLGIFLREVLSQLMVWSDGKTFEAERQLRKSWRKKFSQPALISHREYLTCMNAWDNRLCTVFEVLLKTGEHTHIKNSILVLRRLHGLYPFAKAKGSKILRQVEAVRDTDSRQDLKTLARGFHAMLSPRLEGLPASIHADDGRRVKSVPPAPSQPPVASQAVRRDTRPAPAQSERKDWAGRRPAGGRGSSLQVSRGGEAFAGDAPRDGDGRPRASPPPPRDHFGGRGGHGHAQGHHRGGQPHRPGGPEPQRGTKRPRDGDRGGGGMHGPKGARRDDRGGPGSRRGPPRGVRR